MGTKRGEASGCVLIEEAAYFVLLDGGSKSFGPSGGFDITKAFLELGRGQIGVTEVGASKVRAVEDGVVEGGRGVCVIASGEVRVAEVSGNEIGVGEVSLPELASVRFAPTSG